MSEPRRDYSFRKPAPEPPLAPVRVEREARVRPVVGYRVEPGEALSDPLVTEVHEIEVHLVTALGWSR